MPKVGKKHFKYTKAGYAKAKAYAKKVGKKLVYKNVKRINSYDRKVCFFAFQKWQSYILIALMIGMGIFMRHASFIPKNVLLLIYVMVGTALSSASYFYFKSFFKKPIST